MGTYHCAICNHLRDDDRDNCHQLADDATKCICEQCVEALEATGEGFLCVDCDKVFRGDVVSVESGYGITCEDCDSKHPLAED